MVTSANVERLGRIISKETPVLSVYLDIGPTRVVKQPYKITLKTMLREIEERIEDRNLRKEFLRDAQRVTDFIETEMIQRGRGVAIFSSVGAGLWEVYQTQVPLRNIARYEPTPYTKPLVGLLENNSRYCVALVDKEKARVITVFCGEVVDESEVFNLVPPKHKQGGWSQADFQRHHEAHVSWHLKDVLAHLEQRCEQSKAGHIILGGTEEPLAEFRKLLPKPLAERVVGTITSPVTASAADVLKDALPVIEQTERKKEERQVDRLFALASQDGGLATMGLEPTLDALLQGRVGVLLVVDGFTAQGWRCIDCGQLVAKQSDGCPACSGSEMVAVDLVDAMVDQTYQLEGEVDILHGEPAARLERGGSIGALLRF